MSTSKPASTTTALPANSAPAAAVVPLPPVREARGIRRADELAASGHVDQALALLRRLLREQPGATRASLRMATLLREARRAQEALEVLRAAIERAPCDPAPREAIAETCLEMGLLDDAIAHSRALLRLSRRSLLARDLLSAAYLQRGMLDASLRVTDEMILLDPADADNHFKRGVLLQQQGRLGPAVRAFERVLALAPESEVAEESRAALEMIDNYQIRQIITLAVEDVPFRVHLRRAPADAVAARGFSLSETGVFALSQMRFDDLPPAPPGWQHYQYH